jgi:hypothetical protein
MSRRAAPAEWVGIFGGSAETEISLEQGDIVGKLILDRL